MTEKILEKISKYNLFNYLLPWVIFTIITSKILNINFTNNNEDLITYLFVYYFLWMVISRFWSLVVEPILKKIKFIEFADYKDYLRASKKDLNIDILSEENNVYRTFIYFFICMFNNSIFN